MLKNYLLPLDAWFALDAYALRYCVLNSFVFDRHQFTIFNENYSH
jgi:hypothetical protein